MYEQIKTNGKIPTYMRSLVPGPENDDGFTQTPLPPEGLQCRGYCGGNARLV